MNLHSSKRTSPLSCDTYFPSPWNFIFEFDEVQHFSSYKGLLLQNYPEAPYGFEIDRYKFLCSTLKDRADKYRQSKEATEFPFKTGRTRQRAFLDSFKDVLPHLNSIDLNPTIRIDEFEVGDILDDFTENIEDHSWSFRLDRDTTLQVDSVRVLTDRAVVTIRETYFYGGDIFEHNQTTKTFKMDLDER